MTSVTRHWLWSNCKNHWKVLKLCMLSVSWPSLMVSIQWNWYILPIMLKSAIFSCFLNTYIQNGSKSHSPIFQLVSPLSECWTLQWNFILPSRRYPEILALVIFFTNKWENGAYNLGLCIRQRGNYNVWVK